MSRCRAIYLVLAEQPEGDRLERCSSEPAFAPRPGHLDYCAEHRSQLDWVRRDPERLARYNAQVARYDLGQHLAARVEQGGLL